MAFFLLGHSWWQLLLAAGLGLLCTQFGFLAHDGAHRQIFRFAACNAWTARISAGAFAGLSYGWWRTKHNRHHAASNQEGHDPDIAAGAIAFTPDLVSRRTGVARWFVDRQGWLFFPLLTLESLNLHYASVRKLLRPGSMPNQRVEASLVLARLRNGRSWSAPGTGTTTKRMTRSSPGKSWRDRRGERGRPAGEGSCGRSRQGCRQSPRRTART